MNRPGDRVGPFELTELIASRPLANLWKANRADGVNREPRSVVVRIAHHTMDTRAMGELRKEYDALRGIDDPRIRKTHGFFAGFGALALEFVEGVSLRSVVEKAGTAGQELELPTVVDIGIELVSALRVVHEAGVVHGRICADTVRIRADGGVVVTDFALPVERLVVVPPELKTGHVALASTDQWLVGALLVQLVTGEPLLGGSLGDPGDGRRDVRPWVSAVSARSAALGRVIARMLARDARDRYPDEGMLLRDLLATLRSLEGLPDREALARRNLGPRAPAAPALMPPPTPRMAPAPLHRPVQIRPLPGGSSRLDLATTLPPENVEPEAGAFDAPQPTEVVRPRSPFDPPQATLVEGPRSAAPQAAPPVAAPIARAQVSPARIPGRIHPREVAPPTELVAHEDAAPAPPRAPPARAFTATGPELIEAVHEESSDIPEIPSSPRQERVPEPEPEGAPAAPRLIPDWFAAFTLVCLLAIGAWAVASRFF